MNEVTMAREITASGARVDIRGLERVFPTPDGGSFLALQSLDLEIKPGEFVALLGPSGCGKTTLLRLIKGLDTPTAGSISAVATDSGVEQAARSSFVFQQPSLLPWKTVESNVLFGPSLRANRDEVADSEVLEARLAMLLELTGLERFAKYFPVQLSGGMQQRVNLARALATNPNLLLMDEPFSALDAMTKERLQLELLRIVSHLQATVVFVTHDIREAAFLADRVVVMASRPGRVVHTVKVRAPEVRDEDYQQSVELAQQARELWEMLREVSMSSPEDELAAVGT